VLAASLRDRERDRRSSNRLQKRKPSREGWAFSDAYKLLLGVDAIKRGRNAVHGSEKVLPLNLLGHLDPMGRHFDVLEFLVRFLRLRRQFHARCGGFEVLVMCHALPQFINERPPNAKSAQRFPTRH
jgi:hypothetical protein